MMKRITRFLFLLLLAAAVALPAAVSAEVKTIESDPRIARLEVVYSCGCTKSCSGTMISKIGMITPSGSLYCTEHGKLFSSVVFYFGWQGNSNAFYVYDGPFEYHAYETFEYGYENKNDIACIRFPLAVGDHTGWYPVIVAGDEELKKATLTVRDTSEDGVTYEFSDVSWIHSKKIASWTINDKDVYGTYGPPVFMTLEDGTEALVAIHITHNEEFEFSRRITRLVYEDMVSDGIFAENPGVPSVQAFANPPAAAPAKETQPAAETPEPAGGAWTCDACGQEGNFGNFCFNCGAAMPAPDAGGTGEPENGGEAAQTPENPPAGGETPETGAPEPAEDPDGAPAAESPEAGSDPRIAFIETSFECGCSGTSFGTMVGPNGMVIQSEAMYCPEHAKPYSKVVFHFGRGKNGARMEYDGDFTFKVYETFDEGFSAKNNIGYVVFPFPAGETFGWYGCRMVSDEGLSGTAATVRSLNENWESVDIPVVLAVRSEKQVSAPSEKYFYTGVPLFLTAEGNEPVLIGIECSVSADGSVEFFRRITRRVYEDMEKAGVFGNK